MAKQTKILLLEDVYNLGKSGDIVNVKPGYARNFLFPKQRAMVASKHLVRLQEKLKEERAKQTAVDLEESKAVASQIQGVTLSKEVKVDQDGHLYGSVSVTDLLELLEQSGFALEKQNVLLPHPIKTAGMHEINLRLKEGVTCSFNIRVYPEGQEEEPVAQEQEQQEASEEEQE